MLTDPIVTSAPLTLGAQRIMMSPMASKKAAKKKTKASGRNVSEAERGTERITLRLDPDTMADLHSVAGEHGWTLAKTVKAAFAALNRELNEEVFGPPV